MRRRGGDQVFALLIQMILAHALAISLAWGQEPHDPNEMTDEELYEATEELNNPIADIDVLTFQFDQNWNLGPDEKGSVEIVTFIPRISFRLNDDWHLVTRTSVPYIRQLDLPVEGFDDTGLGDIRAAQYLSPARPTAGGWNWGVGPVWLLPTATEDVLGADKWAVGPTAGAYRIQGPWVYGMLADHFWSFGGEGEREVNLTFLQPTLTYVMKSLTSFRISSDTFYDWESEEWLVPVNIRIGQLVRLGSVPVQFAVGARYWLESPEFGPKGWGFRAQLSIILP